MKKYIIDLKVVSVESLSDKHVLIKLTDDKPLPEMCPGQFVEVKVEHEPNTMLRRPISINFVDRDRNELWLLVAMIGTGTRQLGNLQAGDYLNCVLPLGNGFSMPAEAGQKFLLVVLVWLLCSISENASRIWGLNLSSSSVQERQLICSNLMNLLKSEEYVLLPRMAVLANRDL